MQNNKKTILISWFIGVGFGLFFSGIILSVLLYASNKKMPTPVEKQEISQDENNDQNDQGEDLAQVETPDSPETPEVLEKEENALERPEENEEEEAKQIEVETIKLEIKPNATGHEITQLLLDKGVISDYNGFINHIVAQDAEHRLAHGLKVFPLNSDIETVFKILRP